VIWQTLPNQGLIEWHHTLKHIDLLR